MPAFPRFSKGLLGKATKIAYAVLGTPSNIKDKKSLSQKKLEHHLVSQETARVR